MVAIHMQAKQNTHTKKAVTVLKNTLSARWFRRSFASLLPSDKFNMGEAFTKWKKKIGSVLTLLYSSRLFLCCSPLLQENALSTRSNQAKKKQNKIPPDNKMKAGLHLCVLPWTAPSQFIKMKMKNQVCHRSSENKSIFSDTRDQNGVGTYD